MKDYSCWFCKIGPKPDGLSNGSDTPMREAVLIAYKELTGKTADFCFSGWGSELSEAEQRVITPDH